MSFWSKIFTKISKEKKNRDYLIAYTIIFLIGTIFIFSPFLLEKKSLVCGLGDGRVQHYRLLMYMGQYYRRIIHNILKGDLTIPLFDLAMGGVGDDIIGYAHSLGGYDPLVLFSALVPAKYTEYFYSFLAIFRLYLAGLSFTYLCSYYGKDKLYTLIGSIVYCFSGYGVLSSTCHPHFVNPMIAFPLMIVGTEKILKRERWYILSISVCYSALCGYYHLYMMTIMIAIFAAIRFFDIYDERRHIGEFFTAVIRGVGAYILGIGISAVIFFPGIAEFLNAARSGFSNSHGHTEYNLGFYRTALLRLIAPPTAEGDLSLAAIVLFSLILLMLSKKRRTLKILTICAFIVYLTSVGGLIMNGFQYPSNRWSFGITLLLAFIVVEMMPELFNLSGKQQLVCVCVFCAYTLFAFLTKNTRKTSYVLVGIVALASTALVLLAQLKIGEMTDNESTITYFQNIKGRIRPFICLVLVVFNVGIIGFYYIVADQGNWIRLFYESGYETKLVESAIEKDLRPYLMTNPEGRGDSSSFGLNMAMIWRIPGTIAYSSLLNREFSNFSQQIENCGDILAFKINSFDQRTICNALLSVKYHIEEESNKAKIPFGYALIKKLGNGREIYQNDYALPWGYTYENTISYDTLEGLNGIRKQEAMIQAIALDNEGEKSSDYRLLFDDYAIPYQVECDGCQWENGKLVVSKENAEMKLSFSMLPSVEGYVKLNGFDITESGMSYFTFRVKCGDVLKGAQANSAKYPYYFGRENYLFNLGYSEKERDCLTITFPAKGTFRLNDIELFALPLSNYPGYIEALRAEPLEDIHISDNRISGTVDLSMDKTLCMSIPYNKGWSATVDGEKTEILLGNYMFMAVPLTAGKHIIEFSYCSLGLREGAIISVLSICIMALLLWKDRKRKEK